MSETAPKRRGRPAKQGALAAALAPLGSKMKRRTFAGPVGALTIDGMAPKLPWLPEWRDTFERGLTDPETVVRLAIAAAIEKARSGNAQARREAIGRAFVARRGGDDLGGIGEPQKDDHLALPDRLALALAAPDDPMSHAVLFEAQAAAARLGCEATPDALRAAAIGQAGRVSDFEGEAFVKCLMRWWEGVTGQKAEARIGIRSERAERAAKRVLTFADFAIAAWRDATGGHISPDQLRQRADK